MLGLVLWAVYSDGELYTPRSGHSLVMSGNGTKDGEVVVMRGDGVNDESWISDF